MSWFGTVLTEIWIGMRTLYVVGVGERLRRYSDNWMHGSRTPGTS